MPRLFPPQPGGSSPDLGRVTIRCYRQGLGDCFLLAFSKLGDTDNDDPIYILIDCGVFWGSPNGSALLERVAKDIHEATGGHLEALVITHEHFDHLAGFKYKSPLAAMRNLTFDELWVAWTEDPDDEHAELLRDEADRLGAEVRGLAMARGVAEDSTLGALLAFSSNTATALDNVFEPFIEPIGDGDPDPPDRIERRKNVREDKRIRYLRPGEEIQQDRGNSRFTVFRGPKVHVLGPPRNLQLLRSNEIDDKLYSRDGGDHDPSLAGITGGGAAFTLLSADGVDPFQPFRKRGLNYEDAARDGFFKHFYGQPSPPGPDDASHRPGHWRRLDKVSADELYRLALQYDSYVNNTSLVLAFELRGTDKVLLFAADAQSGNWSSWSDVDFGSDWKSPRRLLEETVFYKVGHHGSHNATAKVAPGENNLGLDSMSDDLVAVIPTDEKWSWDRHRWTMPYMPVYLALMEKTRGRVLQTYAGLPTPDDPPAPAIAANGKISRTAAEQQELAGSIAAHEDASTGMPGNFEFEEHDLYFDIPIGSS